MKYFVDVNGRPHEVVLVERLGQLSVEVDGRALELSCEEVDRLGQLAVLVDDKSYGVSIEGEGSSWSVTVAGHVFCVEIEDERERAAHVAAGGAARSGGVVRSVMPGIVVECLVAEGEAVEEGQALLILEAMKMRNEIQAPAAGVVAELHVREQEAVGGNEPLVTLGPAAEAEA